MKARFLALAALVLGLASCQQEFNDVAQLGGEVDFQLKVDAAELATRAGVDADVDVDEDGNYAANSAFGAIDYLQGVVRDNVSRYDWNDVDLRYSLEVYDAGADYSNTKDVKPVKDRMVKIVDAYEPVVFDLRLVPGRNYHFVVFADFVPHGEFEKEINPSFEYQEDLGIHHTIGRDLRSIQIKADAINDERCDAYFATTPVTVKHQALTTGDIVLQRPYGKLRVIATDLAELNLNVDPAWVEVTYTAQHPQHFNAVTGDVTGFVEDDYGFSSTYNELFKDIDKGGLKKHFYGAGYDNAKYYSTENADGVKRHTHMTLFTDYILGSNTLGEQTPVQFTMTVYDKANNPIKTTQFNTTIPIERNHLTTIVGNVLTSATEISVTIDDNFANPGDEHTNSDYYQVVATDGYELVKAAMEQYKVILDGGVDENGNKLPITVTIKDFEKYYAELNTRAAQTTYTFPNGTEIDLNGYTLIIENNSDQPLIVVEEGNTLNIVDNSNEDKGEVILTGEGDGAAIQNNGTLNIESVELESETGGSVIDNNGETNIVNSTLNNGALKNNEDGEANIAGGVLTEGSIKNDGMTNVNGIDVPKGAIENGENATVGSYIKTREDLQAAIDAAVVGTDNEFTLDADIEGDVTINQKEGVNITINGNGKKYDGTIYVDGKNRHNGEETLVIKNVKFETSTTAAKTKYFIKGLTAGNSYPHNIIISGCSFESTVAKNYNLCGIWFQQFYELDVINCSAKNLHSLLQAQSCDNDVKVEKATIQACKSGISFGNTANATLKNSVLNTVEYGVRGDGDASRGNLVIEGSKIQAATPVIIRRMKTDGYKVSMNNNTLDKKSGFYHVVFTNGEDDEAYAAPTGKFEYTGFNADWVVFPYTWEVKSKAEFDQALASPATSKITFGADITGNLTIAQQPGVNLTIDGANKSLNGYITVDGKSATITSAGLTIKNLNFNADTIGADACVRLGDGTNATRYTCNVTVDHCTFDVNGAVGVKSYTGGDKNLTINECTATDKAHSLVQAKGVDKVTVTGCEVYSKNGMNFNNSVKVDIDGCTVDVKGYAVRYGESSGGSGAAETYSITDSSLKSACEEDGDAVIVLRGTADNATLTIENTTIEGTPKFINSAANANVYVDGAIMVSNVEGLQAALEQGKRVTLANDLTINNDEGITAPYGNKMALSQKGGVFDGNGKTITSNILGDSYIYMTNGGTTKNLNVTGAFRGIMIMSANQTVYLDNVVSGGKGVVYALNTGEGDSTQDLIATNCTFNGWCSWSLMKSVTFTKCTFGQGSEYTNVTGRIGRPYVNTLYDGCEFCSKYYIDLSALEADQKVIVKNCTVNGVKITAENWTSLVAPEDTCGDGQISVELKNGTFLTAENVADYIVFE